MLWNFEHPVNTLKSLIEEHACLDFSDFLSTLLAIFYFPLCSFIIYLVNKQTCSSIRDFRVIKIVFGGVFLNILLFFHVFQTFDFLLVERIICSIISQASLGTSRNLLNSPAKLLNSPPSRVIVWKKYWKILNFLFFKN